MLSRTYVGISCLTFCWLSMSASDSHAQYIMPRPGNPISAAAPVSHPAVSPYLALTELPYLGIANYQTFVQPFVEQRQVNTQQTASIQRLRQQLNAQAKAPRRRPGDPVRETGHETRWMNYSHYYLGGTPQ
jgi:hypothetical protein